MRVSVGVRGVFVIRFGVFVWVAVSVARGSVAIAGASVAVAVMVGARVAVKVGVLVGLPARMLPAWPDATRNPSEPNMINPNMIKPINTGFRLRLAGSAWSSLEAAGM